jgi:hypothetical protein
MCIAIPSPSWVLLAPLAMLVSCIVAPIILFNPEFKAIVGDVLTCPFNVTLNNINKFPVATSSFPIPQSYPQCNDTYIEDHSWYEGDDCNNCDSPPCTGCSTPCAGNWSDSTCCDVNCCNGCTIFYAGYFCTAFDAGVAVAVLFSIVLGGFSIYLNCMTCNKECNKECEGKELLLEEKLQMISFTISILVLLALCASVFAVPYFFGVFGPLFPKWGLVICWIGTAGFYVGAFMWLFLSYLIRSGCYLDIGFGVIIYIWTHVVTISMILPIDHLFKRRNDDEDCIAMIEDGDGTFVCGAKRPGLAKSLRFGFLIQHGRTCGQQSEHGLTTILAVRIA